MSRELFTSWADFQRAVDLVLAGAEKRLCVYDADLVQLRLDSEERIAQLQRLLHLGHADCLRIAVRKGAHVRDHAPRLLKLLSIYGHLMTIVETPDHLSHLRDSMIIADDRAGVIRFEQSQARCKLVMDDPEELSPYVKRFEELWREGNHTISPATTGL